MLILALSCSPRSKTSLDRPDSYDFVLLCFSPLSMHLVMSVVDESIEKGRQTDRRKVAMFMLLLVAFLLT